MTVRIALSCGWLRAVSTYGCFTYVAPVRNGNVIEFRAYEQTRKALEGRAIDTFYRDEQRVVAIRCYRRSNGIPKILTSANVR
jgi:hypothetical protein